MLKASGGGWGPEHKRAALSITLDNFGEAGEIAVGVLAKNTLAGSHDTATSTLPRLLPLLSNFNVTYFIEGINALIYPRELQAIQSAGHEVGLHAWQHESWNRLSLAQQESLLRKSSVAMKEIGIHLAGFRPPGGEISWDSLALLRRLGFAYCSPLGGGYSRVQEELVVLPFQWRHVDAYLMDPVLNSFRASNGASGEPLQAEAWAGVLNDALRKTLESRTHLTVIFHPYLFGRSAPQWRVFENFLQGIRTQHDLWVANCEQVAGWLRGSPGSTERGAI